MNTILLLALLAQDRPFRIPWEEGTTYLCGQGGMSNGTHRGKWAYDCMMPEGTKVYAARAGRVSWIRQDTPDPPPGKPGFGQANCIIIKHADATTALYCHIKFQSSQVKVGDAVEQGQWICFSGNTGVSPVPHLHFECARADGTTFEPAFEDVDGDGKFAQGKSYTGGAIPGVPQALAARLGAIRRAAKTAEAEGAWGLSYQLWKQFASVQLPVKYARQDEARAHMAELIKKSEEAEPSYRAKVAFEGVPTKIFDDIRRPPRLDPWEAYFRTLKLELEGNAPAARTAYKNILSAKPPEDLKSRAEIRLAEVEKKLQAK